MTIATDETGHRLAVDPERGVTPVCVILAPTRELASQIHLEAYKLSIGSNVRSVCLYGGADIKKQLTELSFGCDIVIATPGRLNDILDRGIISMSKVKFLAFDEGDRMLDMGFEVCLFLCLTISASFCNNCLFVCLTTLVVASN